MSTPTRREDTNLTKNIQLLVEQRVFYGIRNTSTVPWLHAPRHYEEFSCLKPSLPSGVTVSPEELKGPRVATRARRYGSSYHHAARWPKDGLFEARIPVLMTVAAGSTDLRIADYWLHAPEGVFVLIPAGVPIANASQPHLCKEHQESGFCDLLWVSPLMSGISGLQIWTCTSRKFQHYEMNGGLPCSIFNSTLADCWQALVGASTQFGRGHNSTAGVVLQGLLQALFQLILHEMKVGQGLSAAPRARQVDARIHAKPITQACEYARANLGRPLRIDEVAHHVYLSRTQFVQRFRREVGKSFIEFLTEEKLEKAKELLRDTDWSVEAIATSLGYTTVHLRGLFHRHLSTTPSAFREKSRKK